MLSALKVLLALSPVIVVVYSKFPYSPSVLPDEIENAGEPKLTLLTESSEAP